MNKELYDVLTSKKVVIGITVAVLLIVGGRCGLSYMFTAGEAHSAQERARRILEGLKAGGNREASIGLWKFGTLHVPAGTFDMVASEFEAWERDHEIAGVTEFEVKSAEVVEETGRLGEATVIVSGTIDGRPFRWRLVQGQAVEWID